VTVLEQLQRPAAKLLASGGGRCNITNTLAADELMARFGPRGRFMSTALARMDGQGLRDFLAGIGAPTHSPDGMGVYPVSNSAATVLDALLRRCRQVGAELRTAARVGELLLEGGLVRGVRVGDEAIDADAVIVAAGGQGYAALGGTGDGYSLARQGGHAIVQPVPALVGLTASQDWPLRLAGLSVAGRVWIDLKGQPRAGTSGDVLFTHRGVSGPAVLDISGDVARLLADGRGPVPIRIALDARPADWWAAAMDDWQRHSGASPVRRLLAQHCPGRLAGVLCELAGLSPSATAAHVTAGQRRQLAGMLTGMPLTITATEGFESAMVTRGGVSLKQVDPRTLASRLTGGLFLAGEVLDLDGPCGGHNLTWAFASGHLAGLAAAGAL
jgi:predicted Rossmann fold flavoprotein